jgi:hypothetical protein
VLFISSTPSLPAMSRKHYIFAATVFSRILSEGKGQINSKIRLMGLNKLRYIANNGAAAA